MVERVVFLKIKLSIMITIYKNKTWPLSPPSSLSQLPPKPSSEEQAGRLLDHPSRQQRSLVGRTDCSA